MAGKKAAQVAVEVRDLISDFFSRTIEEDKLVEGIKEMVEDYPGKIFFKDDYTATFKLHLGIQRLEEFERVYDLIQAEKEENA